MTEDNSKKPVPKSGFSDLQSPVLKDSQEIEPNITGKQLALRLFQTKSSISKNSTSNTISFYDIMPKYARQGSEPYVVKDAKLAVRTYDFQFEGSHYYIEIEASRIKKEDGSTEYHFPSTKDEIIEDVLRHLLSTEHQLSFFDDNVGCQFTVYAIRKKLEKFGKSRSNRDVRHSLKVLHKSNLNVYRAETYNNGTGDPIFSGPFFTDATVINLNDYFNRSEQDDDLACKGLVKFHNMVTAGIQECDFRLLRFDICMRYKTDMARWLHKRISHRHLGADDSHPYRIRMSTVFNDGNWKWSPRMDKNRAKVNNALKEMLEYKQISNEKPPQFTKTNPGSSAAVDYEMEIFLSKEFINHIITANCTHRDIRQVYEDHQNERFINAIPENVDSIKAKLLEFGLREQAIKELTENNHHNQIERNIEYSIEYRAKKIKSNPNTHFNMAGFLYRSISEDWAKSVDFIPAEHTHATIEDIAPEMLNKLNTEQRKFVQENWNAWNKGDRAAFTKHGFKSPHIKELFNNSASLSL